MVARAAKAAAALAARLAFYAALFIAVIVAQAVLSDALIDAGISPPMALLSAGSVILAAVGAGLATRWLLSRRAPLAAMRKALGAPEDAFCVAPPRRARAPSGWAFRRPLRAAYPATARRARTEGYAVLSCAIDTDGRPSHIAHVESWPSLAFYQAAEAGLARARFAPAPGREPCPCRVEITVVFHIRNS
jgi:TonB family protein